MLRHSSPPVPPPHTLKHSVSCGIDQSGGVGLAFPPPPRRKPCGSLGWAIASQTCVSGFRVPNYLVGGSGSGSGSGLVLEVLVWLWSLVSDL